MSHFIYYYAECRYVECRYAECHHAECRYAKCHYAECRCAVQTKPYYTTFLKLEIIKVYCLLGSPMHLRRYLLVKHTRL